MTLLKYIRSFFDDDAIPFTGVLGSGEYLGGALHDFSEVVGVSAKPVFEEKSPDKWRVFPQQYQASSSACVAFTIEKIRLILYFLYTGNVLTFSPGWIYKRRKNRPEPGMNFDDAATLASEGGLPSVYQNSEGIGEKEINSLPELPFFKETADAFAMPKDWVQLPVDFDTVAATIQKTKKGVMLWFEIATGEYFRQGIPVYKGTGIQSRHSVTAVDITKYQGVEYIVIEDSADGGKFGHRKLISKAFFEKRCYLARYPIKFTFDTTPVKPIFDGTIISAQRCLQSEGKFPMNVSFVERLGPTTQNAIKKFQAENGLEQTGTLGPKTTALLKQKYS